MSVKLINVSAFGRTVYRKPIAIGIAAAVALGAPVIALGSTSPGVPALTDANDPAKAIEALANRIWGEVGALPQTASTEDLEASVMFVLSQEDASGEVINSALSSVSASDQATPNLKQAIANIRLALLKKKKLRVGTGAIGTGSGSVGSGGSGIRFYSTPIVSVGGGSANYSS
jgi:hypothetical protein